MTAPVLEHSPEYWAGFNAALLTFRGTDKDGRGRTLREYTPMQAVRAVIVDLAVNRIGHGDGFDARRAATAAGVLLDAIGIEDGEALPDNVISYQECRRRWEAKRA
jgi:hypothetical protein